MSAVETLQEMHARHWWTLTIVTAIADAVERNGWIRGEMLVYFKAAMRLAAGDPDGFLRNGCDFGSVSFHGHERKRGRIVAVKAAWRH